MGMGDGGWGGGGLSTILLGRPTTFRIKNVTQVLVSKATCAVLSPMPNTPTYDNFSYFLLILERGEDFKYQSCSGFLSLHLFLKNVKEMKKKINPKYHQIQQIKKES